MHPLDARLSERISAVGLALDDPLRGGLLTYYDILVRWNAKMNLTSLSDPDESIDRLLLEPVAAARYLTEGSPLMDLGSGGGSPAIPLALALRSPKLVMVESRGRKAAFLREAARAVGLPSVVEAERFEALAADGRYAGAFPVVSIRAVRMDLTALTFAASFKAPEGRLALFVASGAVLEVPSKLSIDGRFPLLQSSELLRIA